MRIIKMILASVRKTFFNWCERMSELPKKQCTKCQEVKPLVEFCRNNKTYDRLTPACKDCIKRYASKSELNIIRKNSPEYVRNFGRSM